MHKIESGIKIPNGAGKGRGAPRKYPFYDMQVGDSFLIQTMEGVAQVRAAAGACSARTDLKFSTRKVEGGWRCWRVK